MLLCDIELVEENGLDLLVWMNEQGYRTKTVFLTCHEVFGYAQKHCSRGLSIIFLNLQDLNR